MLGALLALVPTLTGSVEKGNLSDCQALNPTGVGVLQYPDASGLGEVLCCQTWDPRCPQIRSPNKNWGCCWGMGTQAPVGCNQ